MKIAHVAPEFFPAIGGVGQVVRELGKRQAELGNEVHVFVPDWDKEKRISKKEEVIDGIHVHRCRYLIQMANFSTFWPSLLPKLLKEDYDLIHSHLFAHPHFVMAAIAAKIKGIPCVHTTHCPWSDAPRSLMGRAGVLISYNFFSRLSLRLIKKVIAITPWENSFLKRYGAKKEQIINLPNGAADIFFTKIKKNNFKKNHKIKDKMVLFFGRLSFTKAPDKFVEIAKLILKKRKDVVFVLRGPDEGLKKRVEEMIKGEDRIILLNATRDRVEAAEMYQAADIFALTSYREGLPLTLFEAMASSLPIVATPVNGVPYEFREPENGFLVRFGDNKKFAERIIQFLDNKKLREKIAKNNLKKSRDYTWEIINKKTLELYKSLIEK